MNDEACPNCHAVLAPGQWMCPACGTAVSTADVAAEAEAEAAVEVERPVERPVADQPLPLLPPPPAGMVPAVPGLGAPTPGTGVPNLAPPTGSPIGTAAGQPAQGQPLRPPIAPQNATSIAAVVAEPSSPNRKWLPGVVAVLVVLGAGLLIWKVVGGSDDGAAATTLAVATTVEDGSPTATTIVDATTPTTAAPTTAAPTTVPVTTVSATTVPATEPPNTTPPRPPWPAPPIPDPPVFSGPGLAYAISDPLIGGMPSDQPTPYLAFAQDVFDKMAADDWAAALPLFWFQPPGGDAVPYSFDKQNQWPAADRLSLLLVNAAPDPNGIGYDLTVAVVANFPGSTSVLCGHLYSDPTTYVEVVQRGEFGLLADGVPPFMPESLLNDPARIADLQARCM